MRSYEEIAEAVFKRRDEYVKKQKERMKMLRKITAAAACVCFVIAIGFAVRYTDIIRDPGVAEPDPTLQTEETVPTEPPATEPPATEPSGNGEGMGGDPDAERKMKYERDFHSIQGVLVKYVGNEEIGRWEEWSNYDSDKFTLVNFLEFYNIPKEKFVELGAQELYGYTDEDVNILYSGDEKAIDQRFASPLTIMVDGVIYVPEWFTTHSVDEIKELGVSVDELSAKVKEWEEHFGSESVFVTSAKAKLEEYTEMDIQ